MRIPTTATVCASLLASSLASSPTGAAWATEPPNAATGVAAPPTLEALTIGPSLSGERLSTDQIFDLEVINPRRERLGTISELVLDGDGRIVTAVLSMGGFLGIAEKRVPVRWSLIELHPTEGLAVLNASREALERAAEYAKLSSRQAH